MSDPGCQHGWYTVASDGAMTCLYCSTVLDDFPIAPGEDKHAVDPDTHWWEGPTECGVCGKGTDGRLRSVVPIPVGHAQPILPLEFPACGWMTLRPATGA